ncbi:carbon-nitrogen hydrolase family protein [Desulfobulbus alkaliphilus]|uniref:carbon-nitrogen hydrolase family protein n=1 Tax=Desulfobulbus alkaliphilus TaxID=869814 RepID=UPI0019647DE6|nr:carbon-nitrogen hydrolase family protein [Desulfobulbus alkaliphilus]MBM9535832.1 carbon-nitrogen hydrolase family protein [Desulfobulbus alkaliphilus]
MPTLKLALIHSTARHKQPDHNREHLLSLFRRAGESGAQVVVAPELAISGYSFTSRHDIAPYTETTTGPTLTSLAELARSFGFYACIGLAERDPKSGIFFNSAFILGPDGTLICRYRKINAECRWACPGDPRQDNTFGTPWGRVGVLICYDCYHSLMPRVTALRGANLVLSPANWPPSGLDPREIWRARALENGFHLAACNRTGMDLVMDCRQAPSAVFDHHGTPLLDACHPDSQVLLVDLPLNQDHQLDSSPRLHRLATRCRSDIHDCYLNLAAITDLTAFHQLPEPGDLHIICPVPRAGQHPLASLDEFTAQVPPSASLYVLPAWNYTDAHLDRIHAFCTPSGRRVALRRGLGMDSSIFWFAGADQPQQWRHDNAPLKDTAALPWLDCGPARVLLAPPLALRHPETLLAAAKQGCDLAVINSQTLTNEDQLLAGVRTIENLAVTVCTGQGAGIWMTPDGHQRWEEILAAPGETCRYRLDTARTRKKRFQDRIDFEQLLATAADSEFQSHQDRF